MIRNYGGFPLRFQISRLTFYRGKFYALFLGVYLDREQVEKSSHAEKRRFLAHMGRKIDGGFKALSADFQFDLMRIAHSLLFRNAEEGFALVVFYRVNA